jgi:hypothetical protein
MTCPWNSSGTPWISQNNTVNISEHSELQTSNTVGPANHEKLGTCQFSPQVESKRTRNLWLSPFKFSASRHVPSLPVSQSCCCDGTSNCGTSHGLQGETHPLESQRSLFSACSWQRFQIWKTRLWGGRSKAMESNGKHHKAASLWPVGLATRLSHFYLIFISRISVLSLFGHPQSEHRCFHTCRPQGVAETAPQHGASCQAKAVPCPTCVVEHLASKRKGGFNGFSGQWRQQLDTNH